ncbi:MAG: hypothetical protein HFI73_04440 [Bacilli bacterium]|nr:hypothetical protein [Bacilli bacterium]
MKRNARKKAREEEKKILEKLKQEEDPAEIAVSVAAQLILIRAENGRGRT